MRLPFQYLGLHRRNIAVSVHESRLLPQGTCGSGWSEPWIRDSWGNADFAEACRRHDDCYDTCGQQKDDCDNRFRGAMHDACGQAYSSPWQVVQLRACKEIANTYHSAVHRMGGDAFRNAQRESNCS